MRSRFWGYAALLVSLLGLASAARADCLPDSRVAALAADLLAHRPVAEPPAGLAAGDAYCSQDRLVARLVPVLGRPVGYKVALTSAPMQAMFATDRPARGVLFEGMLLADGARVPATAGARLGVEADLLVRIGRPGLEAAATPQQAAGYLSEVIPFIELPDLTFAAGTRADAAALVAVNAGARLGVAGVPLPVPATPEGIAALADMEVQLDETGVPVETARGAALMGHPLAPLLWLARELAAAGRPLQPGTLVSLGSFMKLRPVTPGHDYRVTWRGLDPSGPVRLHVAIQ
jgi:2-keto-4-pentenoate hydratase